MRGLTRKEFQEDLNLLKSKLVPISEDIIEIIIKFTKKSRLNFRHHARDFIIGATAYKNNAILITNNITHFDYFLANKLMTPKQCLQKLVFK